MKFRLLACIVLLVTIAAALPYSPVLAHNGPHARFAHLAPGVDPVDIYVGSQLFVKALKYKDATDFLEIDTAEIDVTVVPVGGTIDKSLTAKPVHIAFPEAEGQFFTVALVGSLKDGTLDLVKLPGERGIADTQAPVSGSATAGNIVITDAWARATVAAAQGTPDPMSSMPGMGTPAAGASDSVSAVYMKIQNTGDQPDKLIAVASDEAGTAGMHQTVMANDMAQMNSVDAIDIPAKGMAELKPAGFHIMLSNLKHELAPGDSVGLVLTFQSGTKISFEVPVKAS